MNADLIKRLIEAGTPAHLVAEVALELGRAHADAEALEKRRRKDRERKANHPRNSKESADSKESAEQSEKAELGLPPSSPLPSPQTPNPSPLYPPSTPLAGGAGEEIADAVFVEAQADILPFPTKAKEPATARAIRMPKDFTLTDERLAFARKEGLTDAAARREFDKFADHHGAKGTRFVDWDRAWQNWVRKAADGFGGPIRAAAGGRGPSGGSLLGAYQRAAARFTDPHGSSE